MEERSFCPLCGGPPTQTAVRVPYAAPDVQAYIRDFWGGRVDTGLLEGHDYVLERCAPCRFHWQRWVLDGSGMHQLYESWIDQGESFAKEDRWGDRLEEVLHASHVVRPGRRPSDMHVLDFGMGWGSFLLAAQALGCNVTGLELSPARREHAQARGVRVLSDPAELEAMDPVFDFVHANQVLEHLADPVEAARLIRSVLKPDGVCYVAVPTAHPSRVGATPYLEMPYRPLTHINAFSPDALHAMMAAAGMRPVAARRALVRPGAGNLLREAARNALYRSGLHRRVRRVSAGFFAPDA